MKILILICAILFYFGGCYGQNKHVNVQVDERLELLCTVELLSDKSPELSANTYYKREVEATFKPFKSHPAVSFVTSMIDSEICNGSSLIWYLYQCSFPGFKLEGNILADECQIENYSKHLEALAQLRGLLQDFYTKSHFHTFYLKHKKLYDSICKPMTNYVSKVAIIDSMEKYYNQKKQGYYIILSPLIHPGGVGIQVHRNTGDYIYGIIGPEFMSKTTPIFPTEISFQYIVIHEFSHSFCNSIIHKNFSRLNVDSCLADTLVSVNEHVRLYYGGDWETCLFELFTRANEIVLCKKVLGSEKAKETYYKYYNENRWIFLDGLVPLIENEYLNNRKKYVNLEYFMPKIIDYFDEEKIKYCH